MDFSTPLKTEPQIYSKPTLKKFVDDKVELSDDAKYFFKQLKDIGDENRVTQFIEQNTKQISDNLYKKERFLIVPAHVLSAESVELSIAHINSLGVDIVPKLTYKFNNTPVSKVFAYDLGSDDKLVAFDPKTLTDRAKTDFYEDIKKLTAAKCVDHEDILDTSKWFQNEDGTKLYLLNFYVGGYLTDDRIDVVNKKVFDILFN